MNAAGRGIGIGRYFEVERSRQVGADEGGKVAELRQLQRGPARGALGSNGKAGNIKRRACPMPFEDRNGDFAVTVARIAAGKRERVSGQIALGTHAAAYVGIFDHRLNDGGQLAGANIETREVIEVSGDANIDTTGSPHRLAGQRRATGNFRPKNAKLGHFEGEFDFAFFISPTTLGFQRQTIA